MIYYILIGIIVISILYIIRLYFIHKDVSKYGADIDAKKSKDIIKLYSENSKTVDELDIFSENRENIISVLRKNEEFFVTIPKSIDDKYMEIFKGFQEIDGNIKFVLKKGSAFKLEGAEFRKMTGFIIDEFDQRGERTRVRLYQNVSRTK